MAVTTAGLNRMAGLLIGEALTAFNAANAHLGVGNGTTAFSAAQTDLQGASKAREAVDAAPGRTNAVLTWVATFETGDANFAWDEAGVFDAVSAGTMLSRVVSAMGTKTSAGTWELTYQLTLSLA